MFSVEQSIQGVIVIEGLIFPEGGSVTAIIRQLYFAGKMLKVGATKMTLSPLLVKFCLVLKMLEHGPREWFVQCQCFLFGNRLSGVICPFMFTPELVCFALLWASSAVEGVCD